ncbi:AraC family transcriptional regulator [Paenibacillus sp. TRM 82003]|nr:AraC family transcriptional regulator [Paenibacillus sp. TRM 82003]
MVSEKMVEYPHEFADVRMRLPEEASRAAGLVLLRTGVNRAKPNYDVGPRMIEHYSLHFVLEGSVRLSCEGGEFTLQAGDAFCLFPKATYRYGIADASAPLSLTWVALAGPQAPDAVASVGFAPDSPLRRGVVRPPVRALLAALHAGGAGGAGAGAAGGAGGAGAAGVGGVGGVGAETRPRPASRNAAAGTGPADGSRMGRTRDNPYASLVALYQLFELLHDDVRQDRDAEQDWIAAAAAYIDLHYAENLRIEWLAVRAGIHRSHFSAAFARAYGLSPKRYLTKQRLTKAAELLLEHPTLAIHDLALTVGYPDVFAFTRAFVGYHGIAPSAYRKRRPAEASANPGSNRKT